MAFDLDPGFNTDEECYRDVLKLLGESKWGYNLHFIYICFLTIFCKFRV